MDELQVTALLPGEKGRVQVHFDNGMKVLLYKGEICRFSLREGAVMPESAYDTLLRETVGARAKKRALHLLEQMDRTESQLSEKLRQNGYPEVCIEEAVSYVRAYHYVDDTRYAENYIRLHQQKKSRQRLKTDLYTRGIGKEVIERAIETTFSSDDKEKIRLLLEKRRFAYDRSDWKEQQKTCQFLMRRGFKSSDILEVMKAGDVKDIPFYG